jgi:hypothetical protein
MTVQVNREFERLFGYSQLDLRALMIRLGLRRTLSTLVLMDGLMSPHATAATASVAAAANLGGTPGAAAAPAAAVAAAAGASAGAGAAAGSGAFASAATMEELGSCPMELAAIEVSEAAVAL